ncbi:hypothetical protein GW930_00850 [Candidatus Saccharibacteria bacterium]|nr:hypothetical protein [Candidatus Saccharibacteria bacterium]
MTQTRNRARVANFFAVLAYLNISVQWVFAFVLFMPVLISLVATWQQPAPSEPVFNNPIDVQGEPNVAGFVFIAVVVTAMVLLTAYFAAKVPLTIIRASRKVTQDGSDALAQAVLRARHKKVTKKARMQLGPRMKLAIKLTAVILPVVLTFFSRLLPDTTLDPAVALFVGAGLGLVSIVLVFAQLLAGRFLSVKPTDLW